MENKLPRIAAALLLASGTLSAALPEPAVAAGVLRGTRSCGEWVKQHQGTDTWSSLAQESWFVGFLSGLSVAQQKDFFSATDNESLFLWVTNYCKTHPLDDIGNAGIALAHELNSRKGF